MTLPNFMCLGAAKSGTTTLYEILRQHPDIYIPAFKEPHFFDIPENYKNGIEWYKRNYFRNANKKIIADFTPSYFFEKEAPKRIFKNLGKDMKFVVILRNPVDRAYSHYLHSKRDDHESENFEKSLELEVSRLKKHENQSDYLSYLRHSYVHQGLYAQMIDSYLQYFSLDNFLFIHFEDELLQERELTIKRILEFLEIDSSVLLRTDIRSNPSSKEKSKSLKKLMNKRGWWRDVIKFMIPFVQLRQIIRNRIHRINIIEFKAQQLSQEVKLNFLEKYFRKDISDLERILNRKMNW
ncbi:MAG: sulfotransferase [Flavobacteriales bacterium]|nr:sulfotransferase [Flavobacteriales bacterium]